jgi:hypothetical protein
MLDHIRGRNRARFEATVPAEEAWRAKVFEAVDATLIPAPATGGSARTYPASGERCWPLLAVSGRT